MQQEELTEINNYLYTTIKSSLEHESSFKRCKKKLMKKYAWKKFTHKEVENINDYPTEIHNYLKENLKINKNKNNGHVGILLDNCIITTVDITILVNIPEKWDILCLNSDISKYIWNDKENNIYWNKTIINDSKNFVINSNAIKKILDISKECKNWENFIKNLNESCNIYTVNGSLLSEKTDSYIHFANEKYSSKTTSELEKKRMLEENEICYIKKLQNMPKNLLNLDNLKRVKITNLDLLPHVSLICPFTDKDRFFNIIYTFLKLDYPKEKLELVVIDPSTSDKYLKKMLPEDSRIKILNIGNKNENQIDITQISLGYMLNLGVKYAKHDLICHFFDSNCYVWQSFTEIIKNYLLSNHDLMISCDTGFLTKNGISEKCNIPDISNMIYKKSFWKVLPFNSTETNRYRLIYKFLYNRVSCITQLPFVLWSFMLPSENHDIIFKNTNAYCLKLDLKYLVPQNLIESFKETTQ